MNHTKSNVSGPSKQFVSLFISEHSRNAEEHFCLGLFNVNSVFHVKWLNSVISNHNNYRWIGIDIGNMCLICSWY